MMMNENMMKAQCEMQALGGTQIDRNPTVGENIDAKISALKAEIGRLEESKAALAPLMGMRIRDIREAMSY
jgi:hypothetical protein